MITFATTPPQWPYDWRDVDIQTRAMFPDVISINLIEANNTTSIQILLPDTDNPTPAQISTWQTTITNLVADPNTVWRLHENAHTQLQGMQNTLNQWATDAQNTTVTTANIVTVTQTLVNRFGTLSSKLAQLLELLGS